MKYRRVIFLLLPNICDNTLVVNSDSFLPINDKDKVEIARQARILK